MADGVLGVQVRINVDQASSEAKFKAQLQSLADKVSPITVKVEIDKASLNSQKAAFSGVENAAKTIGTTVSNSTQTAVKGLDSLSKKTEQVRHNFELLNSRMKNDTGFASSYAQEFKKIESMMQKLQTVNVGELSADSAAKYKTQLNEVALAVTELRNAEIEAGKDNTFATRMSNNAKQLDALSIRIDKYLEQNKRVAESNIGAQMKDIKVSINAEGADAKKLTADFVALDKKASDLGLTANTTWEKLKKLFTDHAGSVVALAGINALRQGIQAVITNVVELDKVFTDLRIVTEGTVQETQELLNTYNDMAKALGGTTAETATSANEWLRQGYTMQETNQLIQDSMVLSKVGMINSESATKNLTAALKGFNLEASEAISVVDKLTSVDLEAAVSAGDLSEAMSRTSASARLAGVEMDQLLGYLAVVGETTQKSMESIGESFKTLFARMGNIKAGRLVNPETEEDLSDVETTLKSLGIQLRDSNSEFRNFGTVLDEVGGKWDSYSSVQQRAIAVAFAGKQSDARTYSNIGMCA